MCVPGTFLSTHHERTEPVMSPRYKDLIRKLCRSEDASSVVEGRIAARRKVTWQGKHFLVQPGTTVTFTAYWRPTTFHRMPFPPPSNVGQWDRNQKFPFPTFVERGFSLQLSNPQLTCRQWLRKVLVQKHIFQSSTLSLCINGQQRSPGATRGGQVAFALHEAQSGGPSFSKQAGQSQTDQR